jgi:CPA2 family monovalent cation:H+ antiporter-2
VTNTVINALVLRLLGRRWRNSFYGGALLSQIGEFGFVLAALGLQVGVISGYGYQTTVAVIAMTLMISPFWCRAFRRLRVHPVPPPGRPPA